MPELTDFLLARYAEAEATIREEVDLGETFSIPPHRMLADIEAKRRIIDQLETDPMEDPRWRGYHLGWRHAQSRTLALLAAPYADHPDCREEWRP